MNVKIIFLVILMALALVGFAPFFQGVTNFTGLHLEATAHTTATPLFQVWNKGVGESLVIRDSGGTPEIQINSAGAMTINSLTAAYLQAAATGQKCVYGTQTITGTGAIAHGLSTPVAANISLAADVTGDGNLVSFTNSAAVVTAKVWNSAATPAAATTPIAINYFICGTP